jgi:hypothetical protein
LSKEEKFVQAEFDKIEGTWIISNFKVDNSVNPALKTYIKSAAIEFSACKYKKKAFDNNTGCIGSTDINGDILGSSYTYNISTGFYELSFALIGSQTDPLKNRLAATLTGSYQIDIDGNKMTAVQKSNKNFTGVIEVSFTATKK